MAIFAQIIAFGYPAGATTINIGVAIRKGIDNAARNGADFGLVLTVTYVDRNGLVQTLNSGRLSIQSQTVLLSQIDNRTDLIQATLQFGATPLPGNTPSFTGTAQVLHKDPVSLADVELGPPSRASAGGQDAPVFTAHYAKVDRPYGVHAERDEQHALQSPLRSKSINHDKIIAGSNGYRAGHMLPRSPCRKFSEQLNHDLHYRRG